LPNRKLSDIRFKKVKQQCSVKQSAKLSFKNLENRRKISIETIMTERILYPHKQGK